MTTHIIWSPDGSVHHGELQPEIAEPSLAILKRDLRKMRKYPCTSFIRKPYYDLSELEIVPDVTSRAKDAVAVLVVKLVPGLTNARIFLTQSMLETEIAKGKNLNLYDKASGKGFVAK